MTALKRKRECEEEGAKDEDKGKVGGRAGGKGEAPAGELGESRPSKALRKSARLTEQSAMVVWGNGEFGSMGLGDAFVSTTPSVLRLQGNDVASVCDIHCGGTSTFCVTTSGEVSSCGVNDNGALGRPTEDAQAYALSPSLLHPVEVPGRVVSISVGDNHSAFLTEDGRLYISGAFLGSDGRTTFSSSANVSQVPMECQLPWVLGTKGKDVIAVASGANHVLAVTRDGSVISAGCNHNGVLGRPLLAAPDTASTLGPVFGVVPIPVLDASQDAPVVITVVAGNKHSFVITSQSEVFAWGRNDYGQLGIDFDFEAIRLKPTRVEALCGRGILAAAAGEDHSVFLTNEGVVLTIGKYGDSGASLKQRRRRRSQWWWDLRRRWLQPR